VKFTVNDITNAIESIIGVKQEDILEPLLFIFYLAAGRRYNTKSREEFTLPDSEYADDTAILFTSHESLEISLLLLLAHFSNFGLEIHIGFCTQAKGIKVLLQIEHIPTYDRCNLENVELENGGYICQLLITLFILDQS